MQYWTNALSAGEMTQEQVVQSFLMSDEYQARSSGKLSAKETIQPLNSIESFVTSLYIGILDRIPDQSGLQYWINALAAGEMTKEQVVQSFLISDEYQARSSGELSAIETIQTIYSNAFDRPADELGLKYWVSEITPTNSLANVICQILSVVNDPLNTDGQRLHNAIEFVLHTDHTSKVGYLSNYFQSGEVDGVTNQANSVAVKSYLGSQRAGDFVTTSSTSYPASFDNVINGNDIAGYTIEGTELNDLINFGTLTRVAYGWDGDDYFEGNDLSNYFWPGNGNDSVYAGAGSDIIDARPDAPATKDVYYGQDGNDYIYGNDGDEFIDGGDGDDFISTGAGNDVVRGGIGNDQIVKNGSGVFNILGEAGNDLIQVTSGDSGVIDGGLGNDQIEVMGLTGGVAIYGMSGDDIVTLGNITHGSFVILGEGNNQLTGQKIENFVITGLSGNDTLTLRNAKNVEIDLGNGNNKIELIECENITVKTGSGLDSFTIKKSTGITIDAGQGSDYFHVDSASFKTGTLKLDGGWLTFDTGKENYLTIDELSAGDKLIFSKDSFSNFSDLAFDYSTKAKLVFEPHYFFGEHFPSLSPAHGLNLPPGSSMNIHNLNNSNVSRIQSELWFMQGTEPFKPTPVDIGRIYEGDWHTTNHSDYKLLMINDGTIWQTKNISFYNVTENIRNPYEFDGDLMLSWII